jgi:hypothetical protein
MARVKFSALISEMRGKLNGSVFTKNRYGNSLRNKVTPVNRRTSFQATIKTLFTSFNQKWRSLTADQQKAWNAAVEDFKKTNIFGDSYKPSGINLFSELNTNLALIGSAEIDKPPLPVNVPGISEFTIDVDSTLGAEKFDIDFTPTPTSADVVHMVMATRCYSPGKSYVKSEYRSIATIPSGTAAPFDALTAWTDKFGLLTKDQMVSVKLVPVHKVAGIKFKAGAELSGKVK